MEGGWDIGRIGNRSLKDNTVLRKIILNIYLYIFNKAADFFCLKEEVFYKIVYVFKKSLEKCFSFSIQRGPNF